MHFLCCSLASIISTLVTFSILSPLPFTLFIYLLLLLLLCYFYQRDLAALSHLLIGFGWSPNVNNYSLEVTNTDNCIKPPMPFF